MGIKWHFENRAVSDLTPDKKNPRIIIDKKFKDLQKSINKFGMAEPIVIQPSGLIIGGHARQKALLASGEKEVACWVPDHELNEKELRELNIRLNKNVAGDFDFNMLANDFEIDDLIDFGFDKFELGTEIFGDTSTDRDKQGVNSTWDAVKTAETIKIIIGQFESSINKGIAIKIITYCENQFEENKIPMKESLLTILENGINNVL
jgi:hypothetical protein